MPQAVTEELAVAQCSDPLAQLSEKERSYYEYIHGDISFPLSPPPSVVSPPQLSVSYMDQLKQQNDKNASENVDTARRESEAAISRDASSSSSSGVVPFEVRRIDAVPTSVNVPLYIFPEYEGRSEERTVSSTTNRASMIAGGTPAAESSSESVEIKTEKKWSIWPFRKQSTASRTDEMPSRETAVEEQPPLISMPPPPPPPDTMTYMSSNGPPKHR